MAGLPSTRAARWKFALKPASWPKLLVPMLLGQAIGIAASGAVSAAAIAFGLAFTLLDGVFIVLLNDWADRDIDALKRRMLPRAGSPKTIADGVLPAASLLAVGVAAGGAAVASAFLAGAWLDRPWLGWAGLACVALFFAYSLPPLRLNYRGGGELLEALGVGLALPWLNAYAQSGRAVHTELWMLSGYAIASLASAVASGLGDEVSDRAGGKRTVVTLLGNAPARRLTELLLLVCGGGMGRLGAIRARTAYAAGAELRDDCDFLRILPAQPRERRRDHLRFSRTSRVQTRAAPNDLGSGGAARGIGLRACMLSISRRARIPARSPPRARPSGGPG